MEFLAFASAPAQPLGRTPRGERSWDCDGLVVLVAAQFGISPFELIAPTRRSAAIAFARQTAMYLAHVGFRANYSEIGRAFGRDRTTAAHACRLVEERRDDPAFDTMLDRLEGALLSMQPAGEAGRGQQ